MIANEILNRLTDELVEESEVCFGYKGYSIDIVAESDDEYRFNVISMVDGEPNFHFKNCTINGKPMDAIKNVLGMIELINK